MSVLYVTGFGALAAFGIAAFFYGALWETAEEMWMAFVCTAIFGMVGAGLAVIWLWLLIAERVVV